MEFRLEGNGLKCKYNLMRNPFKRYAWWILSAICSFVFAGVGCGGQAKPSITVHVSSTGQFSVDGRHMTPDTLTDLFKRHRQRYGLCPVIIRGEDDTQHDDIRIAMNAAALANLSDIAYATSSYETGTFPERMLSWEPSTESVYDPPPEGTIYLVVTPDGCNTTTLATATADTKVAVFCSPYSRHGDLVQVLQHCEVRGIRTVYVGSYMD